MGNNPPNTAAGLDALQEMLTQQYGKPVVPVPLHAQMQGRMVAALGTDQPGRMRAVIETGREVHVVGVRTATACELLGQRIALNNNKGILRLTPLESREVTRSVEAEIAQKAREAADQAHCACNDADAQRAIGEAAAYNDVLALLERGRTRHPAEAAVALEHAR